MSMNLTQQDVMILKNKGYTDADINNAIQEIEREELNKSFGTAQQQQFSDPRKHAQHSAFTVNQNDNLIKWQLELNDILERADHILRGDIIEFKEGHLLWVKNINTKENALNEQGVQLIMKALSNYVNRNTILSDYTEQQIAFKVYDFGRELNNLIFMKYEEMGMDTEDKRKEYPMLVRQMVDIVHSSYNRALNGGERRSLREARTVMQTDNQMGGGMGSGVVVNAGGGMQQRQRGLLNPMRYISGKYV